MKPHARGAKLASRIFWALPFYVAIVTYNAETQHAEANNATCYPDLPNPQLELVESGKEYKDYAGTTYVNYQFRVANWKQFPAELFAAAPDLPPCGQNPNASRTWTSTYDSESGARLYGSCGAIEDFKGLYARVPVKKGDNPPTGVFLTLVDRKCGITYKSNTVEIVQKAQRASLVPPAKIPPPIIQKKSPMPTATNNAKQVIKLHNGNVLEGTVTNQNDQEVTIDVPQAGQVVFTRAEIASIESKIAVEPKSTEPAEKRVESDSKTETSSPNSDALLTAVAQQPSPPADAPTEPIVTLNQQINGVDSSYVLPVSVAFGSATKLEEQKHIEEAIQMYEAILKADPNHLASRNRMGFLYFSKQADDSRALQQFEEVLRREPSNAFANHMMGMVYRYVKKDPTTAVKYFELAAAHSDGDLKATALQNAGQLYQMELRDRDRAMQAHQEVLKIWPKEITTHYNLGMCLASLRQFKDAKAHFDEVIRLAPNSNHPELAEKAKQVIGQMQVLEAQLQQKPH